MAVLWVVLLAGGNANNEWNCGLFYGNWNNAASNSWWNNGAVPIFLISILKRYERAWILTSW